MRSIAGELEAQGHESPRVTDRRGGSASSSVACAPRPWAAMASGPTSSTRTTSSRRGVVAALASLARGAARRDRARAGRPQHRDDPGRRAQATRAAAGAPPRSSPSRTTCAASCWEASRARRQDRGDRLRRRPGALSRLAMPTKRARGSSAGTESARSSSSWARSTSARTSFGWPRRSRGSAAAQLAFVGEARCAPGSRACPGVRLVGRVPHDEVADWIAACDVLCQPSLVEPFGQALLEAMACERSVVATRVGGPPEFVPPEAGRARRPAERGLDRGRACAPPPSCRARTAAARPPRPKHDVAGRGGAVLERASERA